MRFAPPLLALFLAGCATVAPEQEKTTHTLVFLKTGPMSGKLDAEANKKAFAGHFENMGRLAEERKLVVAGPFGRTRHDPALRGLFILATGDRAEAEAWASTDPTVAAGVFVLEFHDLVTDAPVAAALDRALERDAKAKAEGRTPSPGEGARPYVLLFAEDGEAARRELGPMMGRHGVILLARLDGTRALALLEAKDVAGAKAWFGSDLDLIGEYVLDDWFASDELAKMGEFRPHP